mgnify:CR=1 FL=1
MTHILLQTVSGADDTSAGDTTEIKWELDEDRVHCVVLFSFRSVVEPSWGDRGSFALGVVFLYLVP